MTMSRFLSRLDSIWVRGTFVLVFVLIFLMHPSPQTIGPIEVAFGAVLALTCLGWLAGALHRRLVWPASLNRIAIPLFMGACLLSLPMAPLDQETLLNWFRAASPFTVLVIFFFAAAAQLKKAPDWEWFTNLMIGVGFLYAAKTLYLFIAYRQWEFSALGGYNRVTYLDPSTTVPAPLVGAVLAVGMFLYTRHRYARWFYLFAYGAMCAAVVVTLSRGMLLALLGGVLTLGGVLAWVGAKREVKRLGLWSLAVWAVIVVTLMQMGYGAIVQARMRDTGANDSFRVSELESAFEQFSKAPVAGKGLGTTFDLTFRGTDYEENSIHNVVMYFAAKMGLIGLALLALLFVFAGFDVLYFMRHRRGADHEWYIWINAAALTSITAFALVFAVYRGFYYNAALGVQLAIFSQSRLLCSTLPAGAAPETLRGA